MRKILVKILQILDGTPAPRGKRSAGQSVVELALITPILIVLFSGMVEIGWFANNYLTLLDATRAGARRGATLQNQNSPQIWNNAASYLPIEILPPAWAAQRIGYMPYNPDTDIQDQERFARSVYRDTWNTAAPYPSSGCREFRGFYNEIACTMIASMQPLVLDQENGVDDIIVSAFSLEMVNPIDSSYLGPNRPVAGNVPQMVVVGRYPTNANECDAVETAPGNADYSGQMDPRDPFDFNENFRIDRYSASYASFNFPYVWNSHFSEVDPGYDVNEVDIDIAEKQVGFVWFGQHRIEVERPDGSKLQTLCLGSEWTIADVEEMINLTSFVPTSANADREYLPGTGLVLVEIYWQHEMLLKIPVFNPVFSMMSAEGKPPEIYVWAAFPLPSTDPSILFR